MGRRQNGYTPLHIAAKKNQMDIALSLLEYNASPDCCTRMEVTPLHLAAQEGNVDMCSVLLSKDAGVNASAKVTALTTTHLNENFREFYASNISTFDTCSRD